MLKRFVPAILVLLLLSAYTHKLHTVPPAPLSSLMAETSLVPPSPAPDPSPVVVLPQIKVEAATVKPDDPVQVIIPAIGLDTRILPVTLTATNIVDTPPFDVGWYQNGAKPGESGTATFNGHFQNGNGRPGIFHHLSRLKTGDQIMVTDRQSRQYSYTVTAVELVDVGNFPTLKVYSHTGQSLLNLITCAGVYSRDRQDFTKRTIVYSKLAE